MSTVIEIQERYARQLSPAPGSAEEIAEFHALQMKMPRMFEYVSKNRQSEHTSVIVPSMTLHKEELLKLKGAIYYEERLLYLLMLLRRPRTKLIFVTSKQIHQSIVDYYLHLLTGVPASHARKRLILLDTNDNSNTPLSQKILERPMLMHRIKSSIRDKENAHLVTFNTTPLERTLSVQLGIPLYGLDPQLLDLGSKSGCREIFREAGIPMPAGFERLRTTADIVDALSELWQMRPEIKRAVVKLNEGFSGEGNAIFDYRDIMPAKALNSAERKKIIEDKLVTGLKYEAASETWESFAQKFYNMGGIVEEFIEGEVKRSPSVQCRVNAIGEPQVISTHDQLLGGPSGQVYLGCTFPADSSYRMMIQDYGDTIAKVLAKKGVIGRFAVDFVVVKKNNDWDCYAIEINLRKGGTTHPFLMMKFLTDGRYDRESGLFLTSSGHPRYYLASDNLTSPNYKGVSPDDLIDIAVYHDLHFHSASERGVVFHLIGAMSEFGKLGVTCIGKSPKDAQKLYDDILEVLDKETSGGWTKRHDSLKNVMF
ncbi:MAG: ATP-grasp domain-containing protein [Acidobacteriota bacterium]|nr:ATP-grasp domain-containing protein [Blastocatellia bacterium]MDW8411583.1 ATP-grasp domain-containing protein [Acidobacteriota bacterium]